jgi:VWFA-related protein
VPLLILAALGFAPWVGGSQESTVFRANTHMVQLNVIVRDKNGPVADLTKGDFVITERSKRRAISVFAINKEAPGIASALTLPENTFSNRLISRGASASVTMILLDRLNTLLATSSPGEQTPLFGPSQAFSNAKQHLLKFVDELQPNERVAIYSLGGSLKVLSDFTSDREQLKTALNGYQETSITSREVVEPMGVDVCRPGDPCPLNGPINKDRQTFAGIANGARAQTTMATLLALAAHVDGIPGRKNLVWLTSDLVIPAEALGRALSRSNIAIYPVDARGLLPIETGRTQADSNALARGIWRGSPTSSAAGPTVPVGINAMQTLADETGGRAFVNTNDLTGAIRTAIEDGAVTYTLGFYVDSDSLDGKFHELKVRVRRPGLEVRTEQGYFALKDMAGNGTASQFTVPMISPLESSAIHMLARLQRVGGRLSISGSLDLRDLHLEQTDDVSKGVVQIYVVQQDATGKTLDRQRQHLQLQLTGKQYEAYLKTGIFFRTDLLPKDGLKTLRFLVADGANVGSLIVPVSEIK